MEDWALPRMINVDLLIAYLVSFEVICIEKPLFGTYIRGELPTWTTMRKRLLRPSGGTAHERGVSGRQIQ